MLFDLPIFIVFFSRYIASLRLHVPLHDTPVRAKQDAGAGDMRGGLHIALVHIHRQLERHLTGDHVQLHARIRLSRLRLLRSSDELRPQHQKLQQIQGGVVRCSFCVQTTPW